MGTQLFQQAFPFKGINENYSFHGQPPGTCADALNVRAYDPDTGRSRGAQRAGLSKYLSGQHTGGTKTIQDLTSLVFVVAAAEVATTINWRNIKRVAVCNGSVQTFTTSAFATPTSGSGALSSLANKIFSAPMFDKLYFADGVNEKLYNLTTDAVAAWTASSGSLPGTTYKPRLIELWHGRIVCSGVRDDPHNWFMSAVGDADNWNYSPATTVETQAIAGNNSTAGKVGDVINTMIPYNDDLLIFGCDHSIWQLTGDPVAGGRIDRISDITGMSFGRPWAKTPDGAIYFWGSRGGLYRMIPGSAPERISADKIDERFADVDIENVMVSMVWDDRTQGLHVFISPLTAAAATHYYYDARNDSFWADSFASTNHNPITVDLFDGDDPTDRVVLLGGMDGYIRKIDVAADDDDTEDIDSYVVIGPVKLAQNMSFRLDEIQVLLGENSDAAKLEVYVGNTVEQAYNSTQVFEANLVAGRNPSKRPRRRGHAAYIKILNDDPDSKWSYESMNVSLTPYGRNAQRIS